MSKIYEAYRKQAGKSVDLAVEVGRAGTIMLFPSPDAGQKAEFNQLANRLLSLKPGVGGTVISFASTASGEGGSFVSYNAAVYLATVYHQKVAWVDANFLSPQRALLGNEGLSFCELLQDPDRLNDLSTPGNLVLVPAGGDLARNKGLFAHQECHELMKGFSRRFDFTIVDLPPILGNAETALVAAATDGLTVVIRQRYLKREIVSHGIEALRAKSVKVLGAVINRRSFDLPKVIYDRL